MPHREHLVEASLELLKLLLHSLSHHLLHHSLHVFMKVSIRHGHLVALGDEEDVRVAGAGHVETEIFHAAGIDQELTSRICFSCLHRLFHLLQGLIQLRIDGPQVLKRQLLPDHLLEERRRQRQVQVPLVQQRLPHQSPQEEKAGQHCALLVRLQGSWKQTIRSHHIRLRLPRLRGLVDPLLRFGRLAHQPRHSLALLRRKPHRHLEERQVGAGVGDVPGNGAVVDLVHDST
mmetsp:Transcript_36383/g.82057  ORF Transcript_36383/g.82057 Transcript_36383/m.82057 type:complete len:232 (+) Transcript_36383:446-1141(+)